MPVLGSKNKKNIEAMVASGEITRKEADKLERQRNRASRKKIMKLLKRK